MANLTLEGREEFRAYVEEKLKEVPEGKRMKLPKETLEKLLFEEVVLNEEKNIKIKFPVWSGEFLRKLDLSEVDFEDVNWHILTYIIKEEYHGRGFFKGFIREATLDGIVNISNKDIEKELKAIYNLERLCNQTIDYSKTNAKIDLSKSFWNKYNGGGCMVCCCNFSGCNLKPLKLELSESNSFISGNDFSNSNLKLIGKISDSELGMLIDASDNCNYENCDLSELEIDISARLYENFENSFNLKNTGAKIIYDPNYRNHDGAPISLKVLEELKKDSLVGCYVNGELVLLPEEREKQELQKLKEEIASLFREQQEEDKPKHV